MRNACHMERPKNKQALPKKGPLNCCSSIIFHNYGQTMLYLIIYKPCFNITLTQEIRVNFCTYKFLVPCIQTSFPCNLLTYPLQIILVSRIFTSFALNGIDQVQLGAICTLSVREKCVSMDVFAKCWQTFSLPTKCLQNVFPQWMPLTIMEL